MSHYAVSKIRIANPNREVLLKALQKLAERLGGRVVENAVARGWNFKRRVDFLLEMKLPYGNGYGVEVTDSGVVVHVDDHGAPMTANQFAKELTTEYTKQAIITALQELGYQASVVEEDNEKVVILGNENESWGWGW